ncbi:hypothetical protein ACLOJK_041748 [Asimina triloba]
MLETKYEWQSDSERFGRVTHLADIVIEVKVSILQFDDLGTPGLLLTYASAVECAAAASAAAAIQGE